jgi:hypothetical protein
MWTFRIGLIGLALLAGVDWYGLNSVTPDNTRDEPSSWEATNALRQANVISGGQVCADWTGTKYRCGDASWEWIGRHIGRISANGNIDERACLWIHPRERGKNKVVFPEVKLGARITGYVGLLDSAEKGAPITVELGLSDKTAKKILLTDRARGWFEVTIDTSKQQDTNANISVELSTKAIAWRHVCIQLTVEHANKSPGEVE